ncbi:MAG: hypothetical protein R6X25_02865 [Candidatus Krumholzibacteriia bacterium]
MWRNPWTWATVLAAAIILAVAMAPQLAQRRAAIASIFDELRGGDNHHIRVVECGGLAFRAPYNHAVIERAAHYVATLGSNTSVYMAIARIAANAPAECPRLAAVLDLAVMRQSESQAIVELARRACRFTSPADEQAWQRAYESLVATAEYPSVEMALSKLHDDQSRSEVVMPANGP